MLALQVDYPQVFCFQKNPRHSAKPLCGDGSGDAGNKKLSCEESSFSDVLHHPSCCCCALKVHAVLVVHAAVVTAPILCYLSYDARCNLTGVHGVASLKFIKNK